MPSIQVSHLVNPNKGYWSKIQKMRLLPMQGHRHEGSIVIEKGIAIKKCHRENRIDSYQDMSPKWTHCKRPAWRSHPGTWFRVWFVKAGSFHPSYFVQRPSKGCQQISRIKSKRIRIDISSMKIISLLDLSLSFCLVDVFGIWSPTSPHQKAWLTWYCRRCAASQLCTVHYLQEGS